MIAYASKTGTARDCAERLSQLIPDNTLVDLTKDKPDPSDYDAVIIGSGVRIGAMHVDARQYLGGAMPVLLKKKLGIFICAAADDQQEAIFSNNVAPELLAHACISMSFGGEIRLEKMRWFERCMFKMALRSAKEGAADFPHLFPERIDAFAKVFSADAQRA